MQQVFYNSNQFIFIELFLYCNNLYGSAQCLPMPLNSFRWEHPDMLIELENFFTLRANDFEANRETMSWDAYFGIIHKSTGFFIECDMDFSDKCKTMLSDFPPAPDHMVINFDNLSPFAQNSHLKTENTRESYQETSKLVSSFIPKRKYVIHSALVDLYSSMGVRVSNVKKALSFYQEDFLKPWVQLNTKGRKQASLNGDKTLKDFFKLMVNACYG